MINDERKYELMKYTISLSKKSISEKGKISPKVGAVLVDLNGEIVLDCYRGETGTGNHCEYGLLKKAEDAGISTENKIMFVTLEPCVSRGSGKIPCAQRIVQAGLKEVYIGTLDPNPVITGKGELYLREKRIVVNRYPSELVEELCILNNEFFELYKSSYLPNDSLFMTKNISQFIVEYMGKKGYSIENELPNDWDIVFDYILANCYKTETDRYKLRNLMNEALGYAYDKKYVSHNYKVDARGEYNAWVVEFNNILQELNVGSLNHLHTLVVGIGNGHEGKYLYSDIENLTIVDIAPKSLEKAKDNLNPKSAFLLNAQDLQAIENVSIEAYVSLRTYQSTYFDINKALIEAYRVLKNDGIIILSISCGYMKEKHVYIDGLINSRNNLIDKNRPYDLIEIIRKKLISFGFVSLGIRTTPSEIYIYGRKVQ